MTTLAVTTNATDPLAWSATALCNGRPELTDQRCKRQAERALALCRQCPVMDQCRAWADSERNYVGVAGGRVYGERRTA